jgi:hypothetical protein
MVLIKQTERTLFNTNEAKKYIGRKRSAYLRGNARYKRAGKGRYFRFSFQYKYLYISCYQ